MKRAYPVIFTPAAEGGFTSYMPDFNINSQGDNLAEAIEMARDAMGLMGIDMEDDGKVLPVHPIMLHPSPMIWFPLWTLILQSIADRTI